MSYELLYEVLLYHLPQIAGTFKDHRLQTESSPCLYLSPYVIDVQDFVPLHVRSIEDLVVYPLFRLLCADLE